MYQNRAKKTAPGYREFIKDLRSGSIGGTVLMYGAEQYLVRWAVSALKKKYVEPATEVMDYTVYDSESDMYEMIEGFQTMPFMSEKRVIWVRDAAFISSASAPGFTSEVQEKLLEYAGDPNENAVVIFSAEKADGKTKLVKKLKKCGSYYEFTKLSEPEFTSFAMKRFKAAGLRCSTQCMSMLVGITGYFNKESEYTLDQFDNDLKKITALCGEGRVTPDAVEYAVNGDKDTFIFDLLDGISGNNKKTAFELLSYRLKGDPDGAMPLIGSIVSQMEIMYEIKEFQARGVRTAAAIHDRTGLNEYRVKKAAGYAARYSKEKVKSMLLSIYDVNRQIITGELRPDMALELFIAGI
jgi:DNA polymerase-3 subunit delta